MTNEVDIIDLNFRIYIPVYPYITDTFVNAFKYKKYKEDTPENDEQPGYALARIDYFTRGKYILYSNPIKEMVGIRGAFVGSDFSAVNFETGLTEFHSIERSMSNIFNHTIKRLTREEIGVIWERVNTILPEEFRF